LDHFLTLIWADELRRAEEEKGKSKTKKKRKRTTVVKPILPKRLSKLSEEHWATVDTISFVVPCCFLTTIEVLNYVCSSTQDYPVSILTSQVSLTNPRQVDKSALTI